MTSDQNQLTLNFTPGLLHDEIVEALSEELYKISMVILTLLHSRVKADAVFSSLCGNYFLVSPAPSD